MRDRGILPPSLDPNCEYIPLHKGKRAIVSRCDVERFVRFKWYTFFNPHNKRWYARALVYDPAIKNRRTIYMHRFILGLKRGDKRTGDHRNNKTLDNRRLNLRIATHQQQAFNRKMQVNNSVGYKGVKRCSANTFSAVITVKGKHIWLGTYSTAKEAANVYDQAAIKYFKSFAATNSMLR